MTEDIEPASINRVRQALDRAGVAIWPDFIPARQLDQLRYHAILLADSPDARHYPKSTRVWELYRHGEVFLDLLRDRRLTRTLTALLGAHHLLSDFSLNLVHPHQPMDGWHIDYPYNEMETDRLPAGALLGVQCVLTLDQFTPANGATQYVPGSHDPPKRPDPAARPAYETLTAQPGTLLIMAASLCHRSGRNTSPSPRAALLLSFVQRWVRPMSDPPGPGPWESSPKLQLLLGMRRPPETINGVPVT